MDRERWRGGETRGAVGLIKAEPPDNELLAEMEEGRAPLIIHGSLFATAF